MTTWVLLRGLARESGHWGAFLDELRRSIPRGDTLACPDLPGNGTRWQEASPLHVQGMLESVRLQLCGAASEPPPYIVVALSLGGMVALEWARVAPEDLAGMVLINTSVGRFSPFWQRLRPLSYPELLRATLARSPEQRESAILRATSHRGGDAALLRAWTQIAASRPVRRRNVVRQLVAAARFRAPPIVDVPALVLASRADRLVLPACSRAISQAWHLPLREHPWAGHDLPLDDPRWVAGAIGHWLEGR